MTTIDDGGPAFPVPKHSVVDHDVTTHESAGGLSIRDYFAARLFDTAYRHVGPSPQGWNGPASVAYAMADAMLKARQP